MLRQDEFQGLGAAFISKRGKEYGISEEVLRGSSRNRVVSEARALIGWLGSQLGASSITQAANYFQRDSSTFSRHIGNLDTKAKNSDAIRNQLSGHINAITQA